MTFRTLLICASVASPASGHALADEPAPSPAAHRPEHAAEAEGTPVGLTGDWGGWRKRLADAGIVPEACLTGCLSHNLRGGADTERSAGRFLLDVKLTLETEPLLGWKGGTGYLAFQWYDGVNGSGRFGDYQGFSGIDADDLAQLSEAWYRQALLDDRLFIRAGKVDVNGIFGYCDNAAEFLNSGHGYLISDRLIPTYPDPAFGLDVRVEPGGGLYAAAGIFDGALAEGVSTGGRGPRTLFGRPADLYLIGEVGLTWDGGASRRGGRFSVGVSHHTGEFDRFDGRGRADGATGAYLTLDQVLFHESPAKPDDAQGLSFFLIFDLMERDVAEVDLHVGTGLAWRGLIDGRDDDVIGLGATWARFNPDAGFTDDFELAIELFYKVQVRPGLSVKPDLQYIANPGGEGLGDALIATIRVEADL